MRKFLLAALGLSLLITLNAQNVGINTNTPDSTLSVTNKLLIGGMQGDVVFTDDRGSIKFPPTTAPNEPMIYLFTSGTSNADRMVLSHSPSFPSYGLQYSDSQDVFYFLGNGEKVLSIALGSKRVAINTDISSSFRLGVNGNVHIISGFEASLTQNGYLQTGSTNDLNLVMDDNELTARNNGTASPLFLQPNQGNTIIGSTSDWGSSLHVRNSPGMNALRVQVDGATEFLVDSTGQVIVNGFNKKAGYELNVDGQIVCEEVLVQNSTNWPDYVFDEDYDLPSLLEVEAHIAEYSHLPNVPSAAQIEKDGILLAEMDKTILRKVEELTLYMIQQSKEIEKLKKENAELRILFQNDQK